MEPTHISVALMSLNVLHAYHKRNTPLFLAWFATYSTSLLYHYTKWQLHPAVRLEQPLFFIDTAAAVTLYGVSAHEISAAAEYVDKGKVAKEGHGFRIHPLSLLTAEGNGRGGGDYRGTHEDLVGSWARDVISVEREAPAGYDELECEFAE